MKITSIFNYSNGKLRRHESILFTLITWVELIFTIESVRHFIGLVLFYLFLLYCGDKGSLATYNGAQTMWGPGQSGYTWNPGHMLPKRKHYVPEKAISQHHSGTDHSKEIYSSLTIVKRVTLPAYIHTFHQDTLRQMLVNQGSWSLEVPHPQVCYYKYPNSAELGVLRSLQYFEHTLDWVWKLV